MGKDCPNNGREPDKVASLDLRHHKRTGRKETDLIPDEGSLGELLIHMRRVRRAVPVNTRLREELRARLLQMQAVEGAGGIHRPGAASTPEGAPQPGATSAGEGMPSSPAQSAGKGRLKKYFWLFPAILLLAAGYWLWWSALAPKTLEAGTTSEISRFWLEDRPLEFACAPRGRGFLAVRGGALLLLDQYGNQTGIVKPPGGQSYAWPALTPSGDQLALVRRYETGEAEIIRAAMPAVPLAPEAAPQVERALAGAAVLLKVDKGENPAGLAWSPDGKTLAYSLEEPGGKEEIFLLTGGKEPVSLGTGRNPAWSPDGSRLAVERAGPTGEPELWLVTPGGGGDAQRLTRGRQPAWSPRGYLAFIRAKTTERVLTYSRDGSPLFTVRQRQEEIRTINPELLGKRPPKQKENQTLSTDRLLLAPDTTPGGTELNWLRQLEMEGVREPRTLLLDQLNNYQSMHFSPDGKTLLVARRDGGTVALVQVELREKTTGRGEKQ
ncbi:TolB protein [Desulfofundulus australicus DSM 11792]|uniref:TolB protein n=1 Tax=Desulfofundulus australicus DSM 11792 TaxID=1121425 RepID=A0A1M5CCP2_9FIRM|nr:PD40 domain-containing protein [Desulfofundulus australicus]SHF52481.1 TolB protein [Desulfofundulus australicus DSM 11792]